VISVRLGLGLGLGLVLVKLVQIVYRTPNLFACSLQIQELGPEAQMGRKLIAGAAAEIAE